MDDEIKFVIGKALLTYLETEFSGKGLERRFCEALNIVFNSLINAESVFSYFYPEGDFFIYKEAWE